MGRVAKQVKSTGPGRWAPTQKWVAGVVSGAASILASWIVTGSFDDVERGMAATLLIGAAAAYWKE